LKQHPLTTTARNVSPAVFVFLLNMLRIIARRRIESPAQVQTKL
jgi:hypothetical protein